MHGIYLNRCIEWNLGSSESLSRPIDVCLWSLGKAELNSSSESRSLKIELMRRGRLILDVVVDDDSEVSIFCGFGVTTPPPSTEIGIMNSLGDFLIGCLSWFNDVCDGFVSESFDSLVDWRDKGFLWMGWIKSWSICTSKLFLQALKFIPVRWWCGCSLICRRFLYMSKLFFALRFQARWTILKSEWSVCGGRMLTYWSTSRHLMLNIRCVSRIFRLQLNFVVQESWRKGKRTDKEKEKRRANVNSLSKLNLLRKTRAIIRLEQVKWSLTCHFLQCHIN